MGVWDTIKKVGRIRSAANEDDAFEKLDKLDDLEKLDKLDDLDDL